jgi:hypothetical protein
MVLDGKTTTRAGTASVTLPLDQWLAIVLALNATAPHASGKVREAHAALLAQLDTLVQTALGLAEQAKGSRN